MKETLVVAAAVVALAVAAAPPAAAGTRLPPAAPAGQMVFYGHVKSLTPSDGRYVLRFDPAWLLEGTTAEKAAVADGVLPPGEPVPNDNHTRDESHKLLTFVVPRTARVTVLTRGIHSAPVTVAEFAQLLKGRNPKHRPLFGPPAGWGYWALVNIACARSTRNTTPRRATPAVAFIDSTARRVRRIGRDFAGESCSSPGGVISGFGRRRRAAPPLPADGLTRSLTSPPRVLHDLGLEREPHGRLTVLPSTRARTGPRCRR